MKKFEVGNYYTRFEDDNNVENASIVYEVVKRTTKTITIVEIQHFGRYNESKSEPKTIKIKDREWNGSEFAVKGERLIVA